jgi:SSS family solute:Na+ symporter
MQSLDRDLRTPVPDAPPAARSGLKVYGVIGAISILLGLVLVACTALPASRLAPASHNLIAGVILIIIGLLLRQVAKRANEPVLAPASSPR